MHYNSEQQFNAIHNKSTSDIILYYAPIKNKSFSETHYKTSNLYSFPHTVEIDI